MSAAPRAICWGRTSTSGNKDQLCAVLDRMLPRRDALFQHLRARWQDRFGVQDEVLRYDLASTCFEGAAEEIPKAAYGYSRDHRPDCQPVVLALVVTPVRLRLQQRKLGLPEQPPPRRGAGGRLDLPVGGCREDPAGPRPAK
jgi:hypothetical protein